MHKAKILHIRELHHIRIDKFNLRSIVTKCELGCSTSTAKAVVSKPNTNKMVTVTGKFRQESAGDNSISSHAT
jgi:hypothetical protein